MSTPDFFRSRLDTMIDLRHPLAVLATRMPWESIEASLVPLFERKPRPGSVISEADLFGQTVQLAGTVNAAGRPRLPIRLMVSLLYLKHACRRRSKSEPPGMRTKTWTGYAASSRHRRCSAGLRKPNELLIRTSLYQRM